MWLYFFEERLVRGVSLLKLGVNGCFVPSADIQESGIALPQTLFNERFKSIVITLTTGAESTHITLAVF